MTTQYVIYKRGKDRIGRPFESRVIVCETKKEAAREKARVAREELGNDVRVFAREMIDGKLGKVAKDI